MRREKFNGKSKKGQISLQILLYSAVAVILLTGFLVWGDSTIRYVAKYEGRSSALEIAEAGAEYYRWHLAHNPTDYQDGTGHAGPYSHNYYDKNGDLLGQFILEITPPSVGSTIVTVKSTGKLSADSTIEKIIEVKFGKPSFAKFAAVVNEDVRFGEGTEVFGAIHSNGGVHFDGTAHNLVSSALSVYNDPDHSGNNEFGVHTHRNPPPQTGIDSSFRPLEAPPNSVQNRSDVFLAGRQFPVPAVDFTGITSDLAQIKTDAQSNGVYLADSGAQGYHLLLKTNNSFDLYKVTAIENAPNGCISVLGQQDWGTWSIKTEQFMHTYSFPANGLIFTEDDVWVEGQINNARLTIAAAIFPENPSHRAAITVNNNLLYTNYDDKDAIALISQGNFNVGMISADILRIDGAIIAQNNRVGRYYYRPPSGQQNRCAPYHIRNTITLYGILASNERYGFAYTDGTGYQNRNLIYDSNLLYAPPPSFPLTTDEYQLISWEEIR